MFGAPTLRLRGDYLAIVTLGFGEIVPIVLRNASNITNGAQGLPGVATPSIFGYNFGFDSRPYFYLILALVGAGRLRQLPTPVLAHRTRLAGAARG